MRLPSFRTLIPSCLFLLAAGPGGFLDSTPAAAAVTGAAAASATISVNDRPAAPRQGAYFADELSLNNSASPVAAEVAVAATLGGTTETRTREASVPAAASVLEYDDDGNLSFDGAREYTWDAQNRLLEIKTRTGFETVGAIFPSFRQQMDYDDLGRRIRSRLYHRINLVEALVRDDVFVYDGWKLITTLSGQSGDVLQRFAWGLDLSHTVGGAGNVSGLLVFEDTALGQSHFPRFDGNGNVIGLIAATDSTGAPAGTPNAGEVSATYEYDPFGNALGATGHAAARNPFRFSTTYQDPVTGFSYYGYRFYDPGHGRWLNRDPIAEAGGLNLYGFVGNDPVNAVDVLGMADYAMDRTAVILEAFARDPANPTWLDYGTVLFFDGFDGFGTVSIWEGYHRQDIITQEALTMTEAGFRAGTGTVGLLGTATGGVKVSSLGVTQLLRYLGISQPAISGFTTNLARYSNACFRGKRPNLRVRTVDEFAGAEFDGPYDLPNAVENYASVGVTHPTIPHDLPKNIHVGQQGKHIRAHNNFIEGRSYLNEGIDAQKLLEGVHSGRYQVVGTGSRGNPIVEFGEIIGVDGRTGQAVSRGQIHYGAKGAHIIPDVRQ